MADPKKMTDAQRAYEQRRAAKAGKSLDSWLEQKRKRQQEEAKAAVASASASGSAPAKKPGLIRRLIDRAHKPLG